MGIWSSIARGTGRVLCATGKSTGQAVLHPAQTLMGTGRALKCLTVGGATAYVGWEKLTTDKSVCRIVGDAVVGEKTVDSVNETMEDVKDLKAKAGQTMDAVDNTLTDVNSKWSGMSTFLQNLAGGNGLGMLGNFFGNLAGGNVSGLSLAGLVASALLLFGRFGWLGKMAGAVMAMMMIGNNSRVLGASAAYEAAEEQRGNGLKR
jgi:phage-related protein